MASALSDLHAIVGEAIDKLEEQAREAEPDIELPETNIDVDDSQLEPEGEERVQRWNPKRHLNIAIVGRPNAGKSTLVNRLVGEDRVLVGPEAGITRDSILVPWEYRGRTINLVDTAGIRRRARVTEKLEKLAVGDSLRSIQYAEIVVLMLDATIPFEKQDLALADLVEREGRAMVIALNKWDLIEDKQARLAELREECERLLPQLRGIPLVPLSGLTGRNLDKLLEAVFAVEIDWNKHISTARLNRWLAGMVESHPPPAVSGRRLKLRYVTQAKTRPPSFILFASRPDVLPASYQRYLVNGLRAAFDIKGVPIRLWVRASSTNPYSD
jgi:GTP-binding protein